MARWYHRIEGIEPLMARYYDDSTYNLRELCIDVVALLKKKRPPAGRNFPPESLAEFDELVESIAYQRGDSGIWVAPLNEDEFDDYFGQLYDWADRERVWIR